MLPKELRFIYCFDNSNCPELYVPVLVLRRKAKGTAELAIGVRCWQASIDGEGGKSVWVDYNKPGAIQMQPYAYLELNLVFDKEVLAELQRRGEVTYTIQDPKVE